MGGIVDIPSNSVAVAASNGDLALTTISGPPIIAPTAIDLESTASSPAPPRAQIQVVFAFTPGPDDQILLPDNSGFDNKSIEVNVFNQSQDCVERMNNDARRSGGNWRPERFHLRQSAGAGRCDGVQS